MATWKRNKKYWKCLFNKMIDIQPFLLRDFISTCTWKNPKIIRAYIYSGAWMAWKVTWPIATFITVGWFEICLPNHSLIFCGCKCPNSYSVPFCYLQRIILHQTSSQPMTAIEAKEVGLANDVFPAETFEENVKSRLDEMSQYHPMALERIEKIIRSHDTKCYI